MLFPPWKDGHLILRASKWSAAFVALILQTGWWNLVFPTVAALLILVTNQGCNPWVFRFQGQGSRQELFTHRTYILLGHSLLSVLSKTENEVHLQLNKCGLLPFIGFQQRCWPRGVLQTHTHPNYKRPVWGICLNSHGFLNSYGGPSPQASIHGWQQEQTANGPIRIVKFPGKDATMGSPPRAKRTQNDKELAT